MQLHWAEGIVRTSVVRAETYMSRESKTALVVSSSLVGVVTTGVGVVQDWSERARIPQVGLVVPVHSVVGREGWKIKSCDTEE